MREKVASFGTNLSFTSMPEAYCEEGVERNIFWAKSPFDPLLLSNPGIECSSTCISFSFFFCSASQKRIRPSELKKKEFVETSFSISLSEKCI
jgi:hypothetical protein